MQNTPTNSPREIKVRRRFRATLFALASVVMFAISRQQVPPNTAAAAAPTPGQGVAPDAPVRAKAKAVPISGADRVKALSAIARVERPLREYLRRYDQFPTGTNAEITRALTGANPDKVVFVVHAESPMNDAGELVDAWGTPFFFHQISGKQMEIMSAGPDREMWDADDVKVPCN